MLLNTDILVVYQYKTPTKPFKRKIWLYEHADYEKQRQNLFNVNWGSLFLTDDIELITNDITNAILSAVESSIPSKIVTIRKGGPMWLSCNTRKMIRQNIEFTERQNILITPCIGINLGKSEMKL